jgi:hemerythrin superfamily protein
MLTEQGRTIMALLPFTSKTSNETIVNVVELLRKDHEKVKTLFRDFESAEESKEKGHIVQQAIAELEVHAAAEEKVFYPAVRKDSPDAASNLDESLEEHHVMRLLIEELKVMSPEDERFDAKFTVMAENVRHHIKEEEAELFARARTGDLNLNDLGKKLLAAKSSVRSSHNQQKRKVTSKRKQARSKALQGARVKKTHKRAAAS